MGISDISLCFAMIVVSPWAHAHTASPLPVFSILYSEVNVKCISALGTIYNVFETRHGWVVSAASYVPRRVGVHV